MIKDIEQHISSSLMDKIYTDLSRKLDAKYSYHNLEHTIRVIESAVNIGKNYNLSEADWKVLLTACLLHDYGFIKSHFEHEEIGAQLANTILPEYGFDEKEISKIQSLILITKVLEKPKTLLESIIRDADLEYLGSDDFKIISNNLKSEWTNCELIKNDSEFYKIQFDFLTKHNFYTDYMQGKCDKQKLENINYAKIMMESHQ